MNKWIPNGEAIVKGVIITAIAIAILNVAKPFMPAVVSDKIKLS